jgi:hypothetical protein
MTFVTAKQAADALRDLVRDPHPSKFRKIFTADSIPRLIELLDPEPVDDPVRDAAVGLLGQIDVLTENDPPVRYAQAGEQEPCDHAFWPRVDGLREALATAPPSLAQELTLTRALMAEQGGQLARMAIALKLARVWGLSEIEMPDTEIVRRFLCGWIDSGKWPPLAWPDAGAIPMVVKWLQDMGFANIDGSIGVWLTSNRTDPQLGRDFAR